MAILPKEILRVGTYHTAEGEVRVTPRRMRHWVQQFKAMKAASLAVPQPWEHQDDAKPVSRADRLAARASRNTGFVDDLYIARDGSLWANLDVPDPKAAKQIRENVRFVSPEIESVFVDGDGNLWEEGFAHIALTPRPGFARQKPFGAKSPGRLSSNNQVIRMSLADMRPSRGTGMATRATTKKGKGKTAKLGCGPKKRRMSEDDAATREEEKERQEEDLEATEELEGDHDEETRLSENDDEAMCEEVKRLLAEHGVHLSEHTDAKSLVRDLIVAAHAASGAKNHDEPDGDELPDEVEDDDEEEMTKETPASGGAMLSLQRRVKQLEQENGAIRSKDSLRRLDQYEREGRVSTEVAQKIRASIGKARLSFANPKDTNVREIKAKLDVIAQTPRGTFLEADDEFETEADDFGDADARPARRMSRQAGGRTPWNEPTQITPERAREVVEEQLRNSGMRPRK